MKLTMESKKVPSTGGSKNGGLPTSAPLELQQSFEPPSTEQAGSAEVSEERSHGIAPRRNPYDRGPPTVPAGATGRYRTRQPRPAIIKMELSDAGHGREGSNPTKWLVLGGLAWGCGLMFWAWMV